LTNTALSGARLYWEYWGKGYFNAKGVSIPVAVSVFPDELYPAPRGWTEQAYPKVIHYNRLPQGGHFAAWATPALFTRGSRWLQIASVGSSQVRRRCAMPDHSQFNTDRTYPGRWTITFSNSTLLPPTLVKEWRKDN
jgi:hypothetical protein